VRTAPIAVETGSLFFGAFTGAQKVLRDGASGPCSKYIFNVRASYAQEARATVEYFVALGVPDSRHFISFDQNDSFGQAGYDGLTTAYTAVKGAISNPYSADSPIARFRYTRGDESSVPAQVDAATKYVGQILAADNAQHTIGVFMTDTYGAATSFILGVRNWQFANDAEQTQNNKANRLTIVFSNVSFVGPNSLAARLKQAGTIQTPHGMKPFSDGVFVSQVVPNYQSDNSDAVTGYRKALSDSGLDASFTSLEGFLVARIFIAGLVAHKGAFTPDALVSTFEHLPPLDLALGAESGFSPGNHNYSKAVFGTAIAPDGTFANTYYWSDGNPIQLFE
jgi:ABC-type branched-subunit amino acid transport system substrate-binding protein